MASKSAAKTIEILKHHEDKRKKRLMHERPAGLDVVYKKGTWV